MHKWLGQRTTARRLDTSFFVGWQRRRRITKERKEKIVLRRLAHTKSEVDRESV